MCFVAFHPRKPHLLATTLNNSWPDIENKQLVSCFEIMQHYVKPSKQKPCNIFRQDTLVRQLKNCLSQSTEIFFSRRAFAVMYSWESILRSLSSLKVSTKGREHFGFNNLFSFVTRRLLSLWIGVWRLRWFRNVPSKEETSSHNLFSWTA